MKRKCPTFEQDPGWFVYLRSSLFSSTYTYTYTYTVYLPYHSIEVTNRRSTEFAAAQNHCSIVLNLLQANQEKPSKVTAERFHLWIFLTTSKKMKSHFKAGQYRRNLWEYLALLEDKTLQDRNDHYEDLLPESLSTNLPTPDQIMVICYRVPHTALVLAQALSLSTILFYQRVSHEVQLCRVGNHFKNSYFSRK